MLIFVEIQGICRELHQQNIQWREQENIHDDDTIFILRALKRDYNCGLIQIRATVHVLVSE